MARGNFHIFGILVFRHHSQQYIQIPSGLFFQKNGIKSLKRAGFEFEVRIEILAASLEYLDVQLNYELV